MGIVIAHPPPLVVIVNILLVAIQELCSYIVSFLGLYNSKEEVLYQYNYVDHINTYNVSVSNLNRYAHELSNQDDNISLKIKSILKNLPEDNIR